MLYQEAKERLIAGLLRDVAAHEAGRYEDIGADYDKFDRELPRGMDPEFDKLHVALHFWDGLIYARGRNWPDYPYRAIRRLFANPSITSSFGG